MTHPLFTYNRWGTCFTRESSVFSMYVVDGVIVETFSINISWVMSEHRLKASQLVITWSYTETEYFLH